LYPPTHQKLSLTLLGITQTTPNNGKANSIILMLFQNGGEDDQ